MAPKDRSLQHNRKRNVGLVFELLIRRMGLQLLEGDRAGYERARSMIRRYFGPSTPLGLERDRFEAIRSTRGVSPVVARRVLAEVQASAKAADPRLLDIKKSSLIKEINHAFGKSFYSDHRIPDYRLLGAIQLVFDGIRSPGHVLESVQRIRLEEGLVQFMSSDEPSQPRLGVGPVDGLVCSLATKKFWERYQGSMGPRQRRLLERYIRATLVGDRESLGRHLQSERTELLRSLEGARGIKEIKEDGVMARRLDEALDRLRSLEVASGSDESVQELLLFQRLTAEVESNE